MPEEYSDKKRPKRICIFRIGQLGDTLVSVPSIRAIREHFPAAHLTLLSENHADQNYVSAFEVFRGSGLVDDFFAYPAVNAKRSKLAYARHIVSLLAKIRRQRFDVLIYLAPSVRQAHQIQRDLRFFRWAKIKQFYGTKGFAPYPQPIKGKPLPAVAREADQLLARLKLSGIAVPPPGQARFELNLNEKEKQAVIDWQTELPPDGNRMWVAVGPGSKMAVKRWPYDRYDRVVQDLIDTHDVWPVIFGGPEDQALGNELIQKWRRGYVAAGALNIRESVAALSKCSFYLGNDTGTMHLAVAAGLKCVAIFSAREYPGNWYPYGRGHKILRAEVPCENCILEECPEHNTKCINSIGVAQVFRACQELINAKQPVKICVE